MTNDGPMDDPPETDLLGAALESVTGNLARRFTVRIDRLLSQVADLSELEQQLAELEAATQDGSEG